MSQVRKAVLTRSSLACLSCRSRHQKCDAKKPVCTRCSEADRSCQYTRSRRGGNGGKDDTARARRISSCFDQLDDYVSSLITPPGAGEVASIDLLPSAGPPTLAGFPASETRPRSAKKRTVNIEDVDIQSDTLIDAYYQHFHKFHPVVFPRRHMITLCNEPSWKTRLEPILAVVRLIGNLYHAQEWSTPLQHHVEACIERSEKKDPIRVQSHLLYSVALFWQDKKDRSQEEMAKAASIALDLKLFDQEFAAENSNLDRTVAECWRRTWWMVYVLDAYYVGTLGTIEFSVLHVDATTDLPCEEAQYESGDIPEPRTMREWDCREFDEEAKSFSSFAYLVGAVRSASLAKAATLRESSQKQSNNVLRVADSIVDSWMLLLPKQKKQVMFQNGDIDELMFQALLLIHVVMIGFHRPLSDLKFNAVEDISSCARDPAPDVPTPEQINVHTVRVLRSVESQISLMALPSRPFNHTPFSTCMISEGTLALLSACKFLLRGTELAIAREQIRLSIGCLKNMGDLWPRTARNVSQIQTIARHVLGLESQTPSKDTPGSVHSRTSASETHETSTEATSSSNSDIFTTIRDFDDVCGWYDIGELDSALSWWPADQPS